MGRFLARLRYEFVDLVRCTRRDIASALRQFVTPIGFIVTIIYVITITSGIIWFLVSTGFESNALPRSIVRLTLPRCQPVTEQGMLILMMTSVVAGIGAVFLLAETARLAQLHTRRRKITLRMLIPLFVMSAVPTTCGLIYMASVCR